MSVEMSLTCCESGVAAAVGRIDGVIVGVTEPAKSEKSTTPRVETHESDANMFLADDVEDER